MHGGYSPGPSRHVPMRYQEAEETFATARFPDRGKPLPGKEVRLYREKDGDFYVTYHDTPVVTINRDGTYLLDHGGYPSRMTTIRMEEYTPAQICTVGKREYKVKNWHEEPWLGYDNLALTFDCPTRPATVRNDLFYLYYPDWFSWSCSLEFPRETLHVDSRGRPVLDSLLAELAPPEWRSRLAQRLQPWEQAPLHAGERFTLPSRAHVAGYTARWPGRTARPGDAPPTHTGEPISELLMVRRSWVGNRPVASVWIYRRAGAPAVFRWVIPQTGQSGQSIRLELALKTVDRELRRGGWSSAPPLLTDVLGNLRDQLGALKPDPRQPPLPFGSSLLLDRPVLRAHWMEPWTTTEAKKDLKQSYMSSYRNLPRQPLLGAKPWPGPEEVRVWFELVDGSAVGISHDLQTGHRHVVINRLGAQEQTDWLSPGVLAAGLLATVLAWTTGSIG